LDLKKTERKGTNQTGRGGTKSHLKIKMFCERFAEKKKEKTPRRAFLEGKKKG